MIYELKRIDIWSIVKISFVIFLILGFLFSLFWYAMMNIFSGFFERFGGMDMPSAPSRSVFGIAALFASVFFAMFYAAIMSALVAVGIAIYNLIASSIGGVRFYLAKHEMPSEQITSTTRPQIEPEKEENQKNNYDTK